MDVISTSLSDNKIAWYENDGSQNFAAHTISTAASDAFSVFAIDIDGDGTIDGYDNNGDGLIDEPTPSSSRRAQYVMSEKPFYARPNFNWGDRSKLINNQNAVNYWLTFIKNQSDKSYPTDFSSKTY